MSHEESIWFDGGHSSYSESLLVDEVQHGLYRLLECPVFTEAVRYGDVIEADRQADGSLVFRRVAELSSYRTWTWVISRELVDSAEIAELCEMVLAHGGHWQR